MVKPVVVSVRIYKRFLLMLPPSPFVCNVATTFMAFVEKAIGNMTGLDKFSRCYIPSAAHEIRALCEVHVKPVLLWLQRRLAVIYFLDVRSTTKHVEEKAIGKVE